MKRLLLLLLFFKPCVTEGNATLKYAVHYEDFHSFVIRMNKIREKGLVQDIFSNLERDNSTDKCSQDLKHYRDSLESQEEWAISMLDSSGSSFTGLLSGNSKNYGNYKQCLSTSPKNFSSSYCAVEFTLSNPSVLPLTSNDLNAVFALCLPDTCNDKNLGALLEISSSENYPTFQVECHSKRPGFTYGDAITITLFSLLWIVIVSTTLPKKWIPFKNDVFHHIWDCFSLKRNLATLFNTNTRCKTLMSLEGLRVLSQCAILWSHFLIFEVTRNNPILNMFSTLEFFRSWIGKIIFHFTIAVDTFFVIGGLVVTWSCLKKKRKFNLFSYYFHRYLRLTPPFLATIVILATFANKLCDGPLCSLVDKEKKICAGYWWTNLLYINNIYPTMLKSCVEQSWYLAADWQLFFFISPFVVIVINKCPQHLYKLLSAIILISVITTFTVCYIYDIPTIILNESDENKWKYFTLLYTTPYRRAVPWTIGMACGAFLHNAEKNPMNLSKKIQSTAWLLTVFSLIISFHLVPFVWKESNPNVWNSLFNTFQPILFSISIGWIIVSSESQKAGFIGRFLTWPVLQPLARLTYTAYLIHMVVVDLYLADSYGYINVTATTQIPVVLGITFIVYVAALLLYLSFEAPTAHLVNILLRTGTPKNENIAGKEGNNSALAITTINRNCVQDLELPN